jgi:hypothetical protein
MSVRTSKLTKEGDMLLTRGTRYGGTINDVAGEVGGAWCLGMGDEVRV